MITNATMQQLQAALQSVNERYDNNISFETIFQKSKKLVSFTLKAKSGLKGARYSHSGRKLPKASWHVHGHLFDALFEIDETIYIKSRGRKITKEEGNWIDENIGSHYFPKMYSDTSIEE